MVYSDRSGRRIRRPVRRRPQQDPGTDEDPKVRYIRQVAADFPQYTPEEVYAEIYYGRNRHDIPKALVLQVLRKDRQRSVWPFRR